MTVTLSGIEEAWRAVLEGSQPWLVRRTKLERMMVMIIAMTKSLNASGRSGLGVDQIPRSLRSGWRYPLPHTCVGELCPG